MSDTPNSLTIRRPDDWHLHLRDGAMLAAVAPHSAGFGRAIIMPNLVPPVVTGAQAAAYRDRILAALPEAEAAALLARVAPLVGEWMSGLQEDLAHARAHGHALNPGRIVAGSWGLGVAILWPDGRPAGALSIAAIENRMTPARQADLAAAQLSLLPVMRAEP